MQDDEHKLNQLNQKIEAAKSKNQSDSHSSIPPSQLGKVMKLTVEIVAAVGIGVGIGILLDNFFNTRPLFIIIFFLNAIESPSTYPSGSVNCRGSVNG